MYQAVEFSIQCGQTAKGCEAAAIVARSAIANRLAVSDAASHKSTSTAS